MVHPITARYTRRACAAARQDGSVGDLLFAEPNISQPYLLVPDPLIVAYAHDPLAVGVYVAIARLAVASKAAVPLSARDLALWMGSRRDSDRAAIMRRIVKLEEGGWVLVELSTASKHRLLPTWGRDQNHAIRPWRFDSSDSARPSHLRGRRVPLALFDAYIGRLDPQPGSGRALISRYLTRPLLDLTDIGVYTIGLRAEVAPTPCLIHLGLCGEMGMLPPLDSQSLLTQAAAGTLTTIADGMVLPVSLTMQGQIRLGGEPLIASSLIPECDGYPGGSLCRSLDGSTGGSHDSSHEVVIVPQQDGQQASSLLSAPLIAWDVGILHESINHDSTPDRVLTGGGGMSRTGVATAANDQPACVHATRPVLSPDDVTDEYSENMPALAASVVAGHRALNPDRYIPPGEWHELLKLQERYGEAEILIWQARASRVATARSFGITPAYYQACAAQAACDAYRPTPPGGASGASDRDATCEQSHAPTPLDPACDALLQALDVRQRHRLGDVSYELIVAWQTALEHPGMVGRFASPVGFAVAEMQRGHAPPPVVELDRWAGQARRKDDRYETWRYVETLSIADHDTTREQHLEARVRALAPHDADLADLCELARCIEAGATDAEALAWLHARSPGS